MNHVPPFRPSSRTGGGHRDPGARGETIAVVRNDRFGRFNPGATLRPWHVDLGASLDPRGCMCGLSGGDYPLGSPRLLVDFIHCCRSAVHMGRNSSSPPQLVSLPHGFTLIPTLLRTIKVGVGMSSGHCAPHRQWRRRTYAVRRRGKPEGRGCTSGLLICVHTVQIRMRVYCFGCMIYTIDLRFNGCDQILGIPLWMKDLNRVWGIGWLRLVFALMKSGSWLLKRAVIIGNQFT
jgi:hypothetical protein